MKQPSNNSTIKLRIMSDVSSMWVLHCVFKPCGLGLLQDVPYAHRPVAGSHRAYGRLGANEIAVGPVPDRDGTSRFKVYKIQRHAARLRRLTGVGRRPTRIFSTTRYVAALRLAYA